MKEFKHFIVYFLFAFGMIYLGFISVGCMGGVLANNNNCLNHCRITRNTIFLSFDNHFSSSEIQTMKQALVELTKLHYNTIVVLTNSFQQNLFVRKWNNPNRNSTTIGEYMNNTAEIKIDSDRISTRNQLRVVFLHEIGHWLGMHHVCIFRNETRACSNVGFGNAIMNPTSYPSHEDRFTELDLLEFRNVINYCGLH